MRVEARQLRLKAELGALPAATEFVSHGAKAAGLADGLAAHVELVVEEIFTNIASYAYPTDVPGDVEVSWTVPASGRLSVELADRGSEFDPLARSEPVLPAALAERSVGGLGVLLVKHLAASLHYRREGGWNRIRFEISNEAIR